MPKLKKILRTVRAAASRPAKPFKEWQLEQRRLYFFMTADPAQIRSGNKALGIPPIPNSHQHAAIQPKPKKKRVAAHTRPSTGQKVKAYTRGSKKRG